MIDITNLLAQIESDQLTNIPKASLSSDNVKGALQIVFGLAGGIALLIVALAGLKYTLSRGNPQETAKAKDTIIYAIVGLLISLFAFSIVTFVIGRVT